MLIQYLPLLGVCFLGAMSPGPSLVVILRHTMNNGFSQGLSTVLAHSLGVALWAIMTLWGLAVLITQTPLLYKALTYLGAAYLAWMGIHALRTRSPVKLSIETQDSNLIQALRDGFFIALFNPKLAIFFIALFSQFVSINQSLSNKLILLSMVVSVDALWYLMIIIVCSRANVLKTLQQHTHRINLLCGILLILLALRVFSL